MKNVISIQPMVLSNNYLIDFLFKNVCLHNTGSEQFEITDIQRFFDELKLPERFMHISCIVKSDIGKVLILENSKTICILQYFNVIPNNFPVNPGSSLKQMDLEDAIETKKNLIETIYK